MDPSHLNLIHRFALRWELSAEKGRKLPATSIEKTKNIVEYSFIVQRSVTYLDLSLCEFSKFISKPERIITTSQPHNLSTLINNESKNLDDEIETNNDIFTEEACKKRLAHNRKLLYNYHLDVSKELDVKLRNAEPEDIKEGFSDGVLLNRIHVESDMYERCLNEIITKTFQETNEKVRFMHKVSKIVKRLNNFRIHYREQLLVFLCSQKANSTFVKESLSAMDFKDDDYFKFSEEVFKFVLDHIGYNLWSDPSYEDPIHNAIFKHMYAKTIYLFEYRNRPRFCDESYRRLTRPGGFLNMIRNRVPICTPVQNGLINENRHFLILEILHIFYRECSRGLTALQMLWRSIPDPFITLDELNTGLAPFWIPPDSEIIGEMLSFMKKVTGEDVRDERGCQPRKLKHYCRTVIRTVLSNNRQLSTGIEKMKLPPAIDSFLRLET